MIGIKQKGDFANTERFFKRIKTKQIYKELNKYGILGVTMLAMYTPIDTGKTAASWNYKIEQTDTQIAIYWTNDNRTKTGIPIAVLVDYGHGTRNGGYVQGRHYIAPAIQPVFDEIAESVWREVTKL